MAILHKVTSDYRLNANPDWDGRMDCGKNLKDITDFCILPLENDWFAQEGQFYEQCPGCFGEKERCKCGTIKMIYKGKQYCPKCE